MVTLNLYAYVENAPVNRVDSDGHTANSDPGNTWEAVTMCNDCEGEYIAATELRKYDLGTPMSMAYACVYAEQKAQDELDAMIDAAEADFAAERAFQPHFAEPDCPMCDGAQQQHDGTPSVVVHANGPFLLSKIGSWLKGTAGSLLGVAGAAAPRSNPQFNAGPGAVTQPRPETPAPRLKLEPGEPTWTPPAPGEMPVP
jgi:hypothetical protein